MRDWGTILGVVVIWVVGLLSIGFVQDKEEVSLMILKCTCPHKEQDRLHGPGNRVHNEMKEVSGTTSFRCTICLKDKTASSTPPSKGK